MQQIQYFKSAWGDIKNSPGWFGKLCLLALVNFIPVFGQIVTFGYLYGWAREIAWGTHEPMPARIFSNEDGKLYRRGWFILVLMVVVGVVPSIVIQVGGSMQGVGFAGVAYGAHAAGSTIVSGLGTLVSIVGIVGAILLGILAWIGSMRISIYDRLSAGFQIGKIWKMFRHDTNGVMRIFGMYLLFGLIFGFILTVVYVMVFGLIMLAGFAGLAASGYNISSIQYMSDSQAAAMLLQFIVSAGAIGFIGMVLLVFVTNVASMFVELLVARAIGYWTLQFDVPHWRGQDDPMPFELAVPAPVPAAAPVNPASAQGQVSYGAYGQQPQPAQNVAPVASPIESAPTSYWQSSQPEQPIQNTFDDRHAQPVADSAVLSAEPVQPVVEPVADLDPAPEPELKSESELESESEFEAQPFAPAPGQLSGFTYSGVSTASQETALPTGANPSEPTTPDLLVVIPEKPADEGISEGE